MTHQESTGSESMGSYSLDEEDQLQQEDTLDDRGVDDLLDEGYSPPERPRGVDAFGTTLAEQRQGESIEDRLRHEEPDPASAFEDPLAESDKVGGDDPDAIAAEDDYLGDGEVGARRSGRLKAPDEGTGEDTESDMVADDVGIDGGGSSAEEAAMHIVEDE
ncbi:MAG TPA: DUF5709 domain-containing protein [Dermatophilaceae bacterium]|jgi:hypothetical protein